MQKNKSAVNRHFDFALNEESSSEEHLTQHALNLSCVIDINVQDLITASVGFDLLFSQRETQRREYMYADLVL